MTKTFTARGLILAGALAFAALPALAQTAPSTQPAAPAAGGTVTPGTTTTGKTLTDTSKTHHTKKLTAAQTKSRIHRLRQEAGGRESREAGSRQPLGRPHRRPHQEAVTAAPSRHISGCGTSRAAPALRLG